MKRRVLAALALTVAVIAGRVEAQAQAWVQVEARPTLAEADARAADYATRLPGIVGYRLPSGWYAIALGPFTRDEAQSELAQLLARGAIPADSYIADGGDYRQQFWPVGPAAPNADTRQAALPAPVTDAQSDAPQAGATQPEATQPSATQPGGTQVEPAQADAIQPGAALPDETPTEARASEAALSPDARMELQRALAWGGYYSGGVDGAFGPGTRAAMSAWQQAQGKEATGILTSAERQSLLDAYRADQTALGLQNVADANAGLTVDLPLALVGFTRYDPPFARYDAKDGSGVQAVLISAPGDRATLTSLYDLLQTLSVMPPDGPRSLDPRSFDISGAGTATRAFAHAELTGGAVKGYLIAWPAALDARMAHVLPAMKASFRSTGPQALDGSMVQLSSAEKQGMLAGLELRKPVAARSGFFIDAAGDVLTTTEVLKDCGSISFGDDHKASIAFRDDALGIALLKPAEPLVPLAYARLAPASDAPDGRIAVSGFSYGGTLLSAALTFGSFQAPEGLNGEPDLRRLSVPALPGDAGGPVLDATGALIGLLQPHPSDATKVLPKTVNFAVGAAPISAALQAQGVTVETAAPGPALAPEDLAALGRKMTVLVSCWK